MRKHIAAEWLPGVFLMSLAGLLYFIASFTPARELANAFSSLNALCAGMVIGVVYWRNRTRAPLLFLMAALSCLFWGLADAVWGLLEARGIDPGDDGALMVLYAIPNMLLAAGLIKTVFTQVTKWNAAQMITDQLTVLLLSGLFLWTVLFEENWQSVHDFLKLDFTSMASVLLDFVITVSVGQWLLSENDTSVSRHATLVMVGCSFYAFTDLWYYFTLLHGSYLANGLIDFCYALSLNLFGIGALVWDQETHSALKKDAKSAPSQTGRWIMLAFLPLMSILLKATGRVPTPINLLILLAEVVILFQNWWASRYIRLSKDNAQLLQRATLQNQLLENLVMRQQQKLTDVSSKDIMTGLYRRKPFLDLIEVLLHQETCQFNACLMIVDIDRLNAINNVYGHEAGDLVIMETARRLQTWNMWNASLSRIAGEEFGVFLCGRFTNEQMLRFGREIRHRLSKPVAYQATTLMITVSIGLAASHNNLEARALTQNAEMALKQAKSLGYDQHYLLDPQTGELNRNRSRIEVMLRSSNMEKDFELHYQPLFSLPDHRLIGAEALIRWRDQEKGYILPSDFIPVAEEIGMIHAIGKWVLREAMEQSRRWNEGREQPLKIAVNLSASQMKQEQILSTLTNMLAQTRVNPDWMDLEITEGVMLENNRRTQNIFARIRELGLSIAIDDFGSGYASFGYLGTFPIQKVKLDKVLVDHLAQENGIYVLRTIVDMARMLGIQTLAEGVETEEQLALLEKVGCDQVQGFLLGRPVRASEFERLHLQPASY